MFDQPEHAPRSMYYTDAKPRPEPDIPMNRRTFLMSSMAAAAVPVSVVSNPLTATAAPATDKPGVAVLLVDTETVMARIDERIYGHFLEHINHSVEDGLFAEQIRGAGFEGDDFKTYWEPFSNHGRVEIADLDFRNGKKSVRLHTDSAAEGPRAGIRQGRIYLEAGAANLFGEQAVFDGMVDVFEEVTVDALVDSGRNPGT